MKKVIAIAERAEDGFYSVYTDAEALPFGIVGEGSSLAEAIGDFKNVYAAMREAYMAETNKTLDVDFEFQCDMRSLLQYYYSYMTLAGMQRLTGINQGQLSQYINGTRNPSPRTTSKIESALQQFGHELSQVTFI